MTRGHDRLRFRLTVLGLVVLSLMSLLGSRLWYVQVLTGEQRAEAAERNRVRVLREEAPRGRILDRNGIVLVDNRIAHAVGIRRDELPRDAEERAALIERIARVVGTEVDEIEARLADDRAAPFAPAVVAEDVPVEVEFAIRERQDEFPAVETLRIPVRTYPQGSVAPHVLGYIGEINPEELGRLRTQGYYLTDSIGKSGVEAAYEGTLRGTPRIQKIEVDARGRRLGVLGQQQGVPGSDIDLALDLEIQRAAEEALDREMERSRSRVYPRTRERFRAPAGAVVALDVNTGDVIAMASKPDYDVERFVGGVDAEYWGALNTEGARAPLTNRVLESQYRPASTIKAIGAIAALHDGVATLTGSYPCLTAWPFGGVVFRNWQPRNAQISLTQSLVESCNTPYYEFGRAWWEREERQRAGGEQPVESLQQWMRQFGFGQPTGIDLLGEREGRVPGRAWKRQRWELLEAQWCAAYERTGSRLDEDLCRRGWMWRGGDAVNISIGQGDLETSPLQLAVAYAAVANGGSVIQPRVATRIVEPGGGETILEPAVRRDVDLEPGWLRSVRDALARATTHGTGAAPFAGWPHTRISVATKTGSTEAEGGRQPHSWFAAFAPAEDPRYVVVVVVEEAGFGSQAAGPVARSVMESLFGLRGPTRAAGDAAVASGASGEGV